MVIRPATLGDFDALIVLGRRAHFESPRYRDVPFVEENARQFLDMVLDNEWTLALVAEVDGRVVGALIGAVAPHYFSTQLYASDIFFYVEAEHRGRLVGNALRREWERVTREDGRVVESMLGISSEIGDIERTRKLYERAGYRMAGYMMVKRYE